jgi:drug/metabolite transporter (DMT)-like permease
MYLGATLITAAAALVVGDRQRWAMDAEAWLVVVYLALLPTAVGFYLWNRGAVLSNPGILAVSNNLKVPLAVVVSWLLFAEAADHVRVTVGLAVLVAALFLAGGGRNPVRS